jgi:hypothetical protein
MAVLIGGGFSDSIGLSASDVPGLLISFSRMMEGGGKDSREGIAEAPPKAPLEG